MKLLTLLGLLLLMLNSFGYSANNKGAAAPFFGGSPEPPEPPARWTLIAFFLGFLLGILVASSY